MTAPSFHDQSDKLQHEATDFDAKTVLPWYEDIVTLDAATVRARGTKIIDGWEKLVAANSLLATSGVSKIKSLTTPHPVASDAAGPAKADAAEPAKVGAEPTDDAPQSKRADPSTAITERLGEISAVNASLAGAVSRIDRSRKLIGNVVGMQDFNNYAVLGRYRVFETGADPTIFIDTQVERTIHAFSIVMRAGALCDKWREFSNTDEDDKLVAIIQETRTDLEYQFVMTALRYLGYEAEVYSIRDSSKARMVEHHANLEQIAAATEDGAGGVSQELAQQMSDDVDQLGREADAIVTANTFAIDRILDKYERPPEAKRVFIRLIERRGIGDALMARGNTVHVEAFLGRKFDPNGYLDRSVGGAITEVTDEALRQTPGAVCSFMSGVYAGMGSLPVIGGLMKQASHGFEDLAKLADDATGAWKDGTKTRNQIAWWAGFTVEKIAEIAVTRQLAGAKGATALAEASNIKDGVDLAGTCYGYVEQTRKIYDDASWMWKFAIERLPSTLALASEGLALCRDPSDVAFDSGIDLLSAGFDSCAKALKGKLTGTFTAAGRVAKNAKSQPEVGKTISDERVPADVRDALNRLRAAQDQVSTAKTNVDSWHAAFEAKEAAEDLKTALAANRGTLEREQLALERENTERRENNVKLELSGGIPAHVADKFAELLIEGGISIVTSMKTAFVKELKASRKLGRDGKHLGLDPARLEKALAIAAGTAAVEALRDTLIKDLKKYASEKLAGILAGVIDEHYPGTRETADNLLRESLADLAEYFTKDLPEEWLKERVTEIVSDLMSDDTASGAGEPAASEP